MCGMGSLQYLFIYIFYLFLRTSLSLVGNLGHFTRVRHRSTRAALPIAVSMCSISVHPNNDMAASGWDF